MYNVLFQFYFKKIKKNFCWLGTIKLKQIIHISNSVTYNTQNFDSFVILITSTSISEKT